MKKKSNPRFNPNLTVKENAEKMGVAPSTLYHRLKKKSIDRKKDKVETIIADIKEALEANPDASQKTVAQITHHGVATINKYWKAARGIETIEEKPKPFAWKKQDAIVDKDELFSDLMAKANDVIEIADQMDVEPFHNFLFGKPEMPMFFIGCGGMKNQYAALLYGLNKGVGYCTTPYMLASLSDETIKNSRFLIMSAGGRNQDAGYAAQKLLKLNPENTAFYTYSTNPDNKVYKKFGDKSNVFVFSNPNVYRGGFISSQSKIFTYALLYRAFTGKSLKYFHVDLASEKCYQYQLNNSIEKITPPHKINHFLVLYGGWSEPVARDFESVLAETGMASAQLTDYRNFCHGRFVFASNHTKHDWRKKHKLEESDAAMVLLITPRERQIVERIREIAIPTNMPILIIETDYNSPLATIDLLIKSNIFLADLGEKGYRINPNDPPIYSSVDKTEPINKVLFKEEYKQYGEMRLDADDKPIERGVEKPIKKARKPKDTVSEEELKERIDELLRQEHQNTKSLEKHPMYYPTPTKSDLFKTEHEHYDAVKHLCIAFRRKNDLWKDMEIPFGNMNGGFPYEMDGVYFHASENAYICGLFSNNTPEHMAIQKKLIAETSGYDAKKTIRRKNNDKGRKDWETFNIEWMLYCVWNKVKNNEKFRNMLMAIPRNAMLIEDVSFQKISRKEKDTTTVWGCRNQDKKDFGKLVAKYAGTQTFKSDAAKERFENQYLWDFCNYGEYVGQNIMGKILTLIKNCLHEGTEPNIDYALLNSKNIYLLGNKLDFRQEKPTPQTTEKQDVIRGIMGAVIGDIAGSRFEREDDFPKKSFKMFSANCSFTDDTVLTVAIADAILHNRTFAEALWAWGNKYPSSGFGHSFNSWLKGDWSVQNNSVGDGSGMRISAVGFTGNNLEEVLEMAKEATVPTHNSTEGIKAAQAVASSVFLAKNGKSKEEIKEYVETQFKYNLDLSEEAIRSMVKSGDYDMVKAENSTPVAIIAFLNGNNYEDVVRTAVSYGGDTDTVGCMAGAIAAAYYGVSIELAEQAALYLPKELLDVINEFDRTSLSNNRLTPATVQRWSVDTVVVYGCNEDCTNGEAGFSNTHPSRYQPKPLKGFPIHVIGTTMDVIKKDVKTLIAKVKSEPQTTFVVEDVGISKKSRIGIEKMAPLFMPLVEKENVYFTKEYWDFFNSLKK